MRYQVRSYRNGLQILQGSPAYREIGHLLEDISPSEIDARRSERQSEYDARAKEIGGAPRKAGIQKGLNALLRERLEVIGWTPEMPIFASDSETEKGLWTMDFAKSFPAASITVGLEVTFNHAEALTWTPIRLALAHEAERVKEEARINVGCIIIGTDQLKGSRREGLRMDSAVGTFERLLTLLPKMRPVLPAPLVIFGIDWADGGLAGRPTEVDLHTSHARSRPALGSLDDA